MKKWNSTYIGCNKTHWNSKLKTLHVDATKVSSHLSPLTLEIVGVPQMMLQQYLSILPCLSLPSGNLQTPFPSIPWRYLPISSSAFLSFLLLSLSLAELSSPCLRILRCSHTIWVSVSLSWLGDHHALKLHSGFCCEPPRSSHGFCRKCSEVSYSNQSMHMQLGSSQTFSCVWILWVIKLLHLSILFYIWMFCPRERWGCKSTF